jgi:AcrR family transcriptional regulator
MCAIAERANSCIGSLYQFFPNKRSVAEALRAQYIKEIEQSWIVLENQAAGLSPEKLVSRLVSLQIEIVESHPAVLALLDVPTTSRTPARCELIRARMASVLMAHKPSMSKATALRTASVVQQVTKGLLTLFAQSDSDGKNAINEEFKSVLTGYLVPKLK